MSLAEYKKQINKTTTEEVTITYLPDNDGARLLAPFFFCLFYVIRTFATTVAYFKEDNTMALPKQPNEYPDYYVVKDPTSGGLSPQERIAMANNETFRAHNGAWPDRPYGSSGYTYSTGK